MAGRHPSGITWENVKEHLKSKTVIDEKTGCWLWQGTKVSKGYGALTLNYRSVSIHRISAVLHLGLDISDRDVHALHKLECPNRNCWNPDHLYLGDNYDNVQDRIRRGRSFVYNRPKTHCVHGHEYNEENTYVTKEGKRMCRTCIRERKRNS